ncbi:ParB N-terminal domain-containing protein [Bradyrhizobium barranii subsp. barranii]|uniref:ParB N-terminal domain-containing protein n=1 Tax=Bradyrhizobium barranii subsp. barranii TaxID=2823807 RepID=A0A939MG00_9BRAD|nr:ParB N-terminal domain-containing protein [Bradyrhizobium barranii]UEM09035.1 ParB N-terminal domain-containing protein [Bradyrhizobium barranii subsp. barranii]
MSDLQIPLNRLKFGHEDGAGINARVVGREDGIAALAANIFANRTEDNPTGLIENLIVKEAGGGFYAIANGNRRLKALHMIDGEGAELPIGCTLHQVDETKAFEYSLTTAITAEQLHPVDQYEAFALLEERGKSEEEIAQQYGLSAKQVLQALALGRLSPKIRQAWRAGDLVAEAAQAFTLALDHKTQDKVFEKLSKGGGRVQHWSVKRELGADALDRDVAQLVEFIGADAYRARGGVLTEDLFGSSHIVSDEALLKQMARDVLTAKCEELRADGWAWAEIVTDLPQGARWWPKPEIRKLPYEGDELERRTRAEATATELEESDEWNDSMHDELDRLRIEVETIDSAVRMRAFDAKKRKTLGCIVDVEEGKLTVLYGIKKPENAKLSKGDPEAAKRVQAAAPAAKGNAADEPEISNALLHRLSVQLTKAAATALIQDEHLALSVLLAGFGCYEGDGIKVSANGLGRRGNDRSILGAEEMKKALPLAMAMKPAERISLLAQIAADALDFQNCALDQDDRHDGALAICGAIDAKLFNPAMRGAFDAKDYFGGVSKALCLKAIEEAMGADMSRQQGKKQKTDIVAFAIENVPTTGWLPPQLRHKGYDGPPVKAKGKATPPAPAKKPVKSAVKKTAKKSAKKTAKKKK